MRAAVVSTAMAWVLLWGVAATADDFDRLTTYATAIGRALGCGANTDEASRRVSGWMDRRFVGREKGEMLQIFAATMQRAYADQRGGRSPDSCGTVLREFERFPWP